MCCAAAPSFGSCLQQFASTKLQRRDARPRQVLDNMALDAIAQQQLGIEKPSVAEGNSLVSAVMAGATAPARFPSALQLQMQNTHETARGHDGRRGQR